VFGKFTQYAIQNYPGRPQIRPETKEFFMKIGKQVRKRRKELNLSLRDLGKRAGVTASFLSQVENDQVSPSLNSLQSIATALNAPMFSLLNDTPSGNVIKATERRQVTFQDSKISYDLLTPDFTRQMMAYLIYVEPHANRIAMKLAKPTEQWMHVVQGQMRIVIGDKTRHLDQGDTVYYDGDLLREFGSVSDEDLVIMCCITPPVF
jgi:transcriptional regulator with XRE-family HTH domain